MNKLNKKIISFVLLFSICLLINVSCAEFSSVPLSGSETLNEYDSQHKATAFGDYTGLQIRSITRNYFLNEGNEDYALPFNEMIEHFNTKGYSYLVEKVTSQDIYVGILSTGNASFGARYDATTGKTNIYGTRIDTSKTCAIYLMLFTNTSSASGDVVTITGSPNYAYYSKEATLIYSNVDVKQIVYSGGAVWDGTSYFYKVGTEEPEDPIMPTNAEIASVVQSFYDSDLYKTNTNFKDFMVLYSFATGYYSIIGTDNHLLQEIYYDGAKPSNDDFTYPETWWRFYNYFGNVQNFFYGRNYWLYSTRKENDVFLPLKYNGVGKINDLFELKFSTQSIIVYSSYEYKVYEFRPPIDETDVNQTTETTVPGDEYTYNETLNPTDSNYSPIQNYIPANPSQTILGDVDFSEINKTFEENKNILNIEGASWLFTANNRLVGYFIGFLSLLIVFLIISRILGG